jgi:hypothetical protein
MLIQCPAYNNRRRNFMNNIPGPIKQGLSKASVIGAVLGVLAIVLFVILWVVLGQLGLEPLARLFGAICIPPAVIAGLMGAYILWARPGTPPKE